MRNLIIDKKRKQHEVLTPFSRDSAASIMDEVARHRRTEAARYDVMVVKAFLQELKADDSQRIEYEALIAFFNDEPVAAVARRLGTSQKQVYYRLDKALKRLRNLLDPSHGGTDK